VLVVAFVVRLVVGFLVRLVIGLVVGLGVVVRLGHDRRRHLERCRRTEPDDDEELPSGLGVPRDEQDPRGIRDAYRQLAKQYHPDRAGPEGATAFRDVVEAYEVLSHDEQRALHDEGLRHAEGRLDVAPDSIVLADDVPPEPLAPVPVSIPRGFRHVGPSPEELLDRILHNLLTARASKAERLQALDAELVLSAAEVERGGVVRLGVTASLV
jgi:DnaJ domain